MQSQNPQDGLYLFDSKHLYQLSVATGKTNKKFPALSNIQSQISVLSHSPSGSHVAGLTQSGDMFVWQRKTNVVETYLTPFSNLGVKKLQAENYSGI